MGCRYAYLRGCCAYLSRLPLIPQEAAANRSVKTVLEQLKALGHDADAIWASVEDVCLRTVAVKLPHLWQTYHYWYKALSC